MKSIWDESTRDEVLTRFGRLRADQRPQWGQMDVPAMIGHVCDAMRAALGEIAIAERNTIMKNPVVRWLIIYVMPWPKGAPTAPELLQRKETDLTHGIAALQATMTRFADCPSPKPHPVFGVMSRKDWGCLTYRHLDHHLRQFGV